EGAEIALVVRVGRLEGAVADGGLVAEGAEEPHRFLAVGAEDPAPLFHGETDGVGSGEDLRPGGVVAKVVVARGVGSGLDDGAELSGMAVGASRPGPLPGTRGCGDPTSAVVGERLLPLAFEGAATAEE